MCILGWVETCFNTLINFVLTKDFDGKVEAFTIFKEVQNILTASLAIIVGLGIELEYILWTIGCISVICYPFTWIYLSKKEMIGGKGTTFMTQTTEKKAKS